MADYSVDYTFHSGIDKNGKTRYFYTNNQSGKKVELPDADTYNNFKNKADQVTNKDISDMDKAQREANPVIQEMDDLSAGFKARQKGMAPARSLRDRATDAFKELDAASPTGNKKGGRIKLKASKVNTAQKNTKHKSW